MAEKQNKMFNFNFWTSMLRKKYIIDFQRLSIILVM